MSEAIFPIAGGVISSKNSRLSCVIKEPNLLASSRLTLEQIDEEYNLQRLTGCEICTKMGFDKRYSKYFGYTTATHDFLPTDWWNPPAPLETMQVAFPTHVIQIRSSTPTLLVIGELAKMHIRMKCTRTESHNSIMMSCRSIH